MIMITTATTGKGHSLYTRDIVYIDVRAAGMDFSVCRFSLKFSICKLRNITDSQFQLSNKLLACKFSTSIYRRLGHGIAFPSIIKKSRDKHML